MRKIYFLFPRMNINAGGHLAQLMLFENAKSICPVEAVTYEAREEGTLFLDEVLSKNDDNDQVMFFAHWGPHVSALIQQLASKNVVYVSYSTGYGFKIPPSVPILAGSKHTQAYWGKYSPNSPIFYLPCEIPEKFTNLHLNRDIDVLVQKRKSSRYLLEELVPILRPHCSVTVLDTWVEDLAEMFNRSKIYLYDSTEYWAQHGVSEGFGLPPLEALASGCTVFSSLNDALSDYLEPEFNCHQLRVYSKEYDAARILNALKEWKDEQQEHDPAQRYRKISIRKSLNVVLAQLNDFFDKKKLHQENIADIGLLPHEAEIQILRARLEKIENSLGWRLLERPRIIYAKLLQMLKRSG
ncbi:MAG: hypothetical protein CVU44_15460 [Chloroflexi bacterium HGW-Chloroflexi-6]|nr:MAG: hypothetical protein CVU44_15460 [Chloroflexi bacterium HGW-Chloroflexi-6]